MKEKNIPELNIGVFGHIDHGKTTLLKSLTGKLTDSHSEELKRGITIKLGYSEMTIYSDGKNYSRKKEKNYFPKKYISFIDAPGHEMLMATMLSGAAIIDSAILVIAANEGIKPQTREHFAALQAKKISNIIIVQNKIDLLDANKAKENYKEIKKLIEGTPAENAPIIPISAQQEVNIDVLLREIDKIKVPEKDYKSEPIFLVARSFDINKPGTEIKDLRGGILGGILKKGKLKVGDKIEIKPGFSYKKHNQVEYETLKTKILSLRKGEESVEEVYPGPSIAIETELDPSLTKTDSLKGCVVSKEGILPEASYSVKIKYELFKELFGEEGHKKIDQLKTAEKLMLSVNTNITLGNIEKTSENILEIILDIPIVALEGNNVGIAKNLNGHWRLIGHGQILK